MIQRHEVCQRSSEVVVINVDMTDTDLICLHYIFHPGPKNCVGNPSIAGACSLNLVGLSLCQLGVYRH